MKIAIVAGECARYLTVTGLDLVVRCLCRALQRSKEVEEVCLVLPHYGGCDVLLMPSKFEPAGLNQLQALCVGTPVIGTRKGSMPDVVRHQARSAARNGWLFDNPADLPAFVECCQAAVTSFQSPIHWLRIIKSAYNSVSDWDQVIAQSYLPVYRKLIESNGHSAPSVSDIGCG